MIRQYLIVLLAKLSFFFLTDTIHRCFFNFQPISPVGESLTKVARIHAKKPSFNDWYRLDCARAKPVSFLCKKNYVQTEKKSHFQNFASVYWSKKLYQVSPINGLQHYWIRLNSYQFHVICDKVLSIVCKLCHTPCPAKRNWKALSSVTF